MGDERRDPAFAKGHLNPEDFNRLKRIEGHNHARALNWACFHNRPFLKSECACEWLVEAIEKARERFDFHVWAWCFMPTHAHLLVFAKPARLGGGPLAPVIQAIKQSVSRKAVAWARKRAPSKLGLMRDDSPSGEIVHRFWQRGGGYDRNLWSERAIWNEIDYIHSNPVEAGLCERDIDWPWSSAGPFKTRKPGPITLDWSKLPPRR
ncbi:MAG: transposase [Planctomycetes bacterium]|nr:transposase [Planctomycetota bacterium]